MPKQANYGDDKEPSRLLSATQGKLGVTMRLYAPKD